MISIAMSLGSLIQNIPQTDEKDKWSYTWTSPQYSSMKMYKNICGQAEAHSIFKQLWKAFCTLGHKIFFWLVAHCRINTRALIKRKGMHLDDPYCPLTAIKRRGDHYAFALGLQLCTRMLEYYFSRQEKRHL